MSNTREALRMVIAQELYRQHCGILRIVPAAWTLLTSVQRENWLTRADQFFAVDPSVTALEARVKLLETENERLAKAWETKHDSMVKERVRNAADEAKMQFRIGELLALVAAAEAKLSTAVWIDGDNAGPGERVIERLEARAISAEDVCHALLEYDAGLKDNETDTTRLYQALLAKARAVCEQSKDPAT